MVRDRLPDLLQRSLQTSNGSLDQAVIMTELSTNVDAILNPYTEIRILLGTIVSNLETMNRMVQSINIRNFNEKELEELRNENLKIGTQLMAKFKDFKANLPPDDDYCLEARMKRTLFYGLHQSYINIWTRNEAFLQSYEDKLKKNLQLHSKIMNFNSTEEEVEELIANKTTSLFVGNILEETEKERRTLRDLMDRFSELKKLEKSLEDVHALFLRIQNLVLEQSETIQLVEYHAQQATLHIDKGADELEQAHVLKKKTRKKKMILLVIILTILLILIFVAIYL